VYAWTACGQKVRGVAPCFKPCAKQIMTAVKSDSCQHLCQQPCHETQQSVCMKLKTEKSDSITRPTNGHAAACSFLDIIHVLQPLLLEQQHCSFR
jgi:hypothetical protein